MTKLVKIVKPGKYNNQHGKATQLGKDAVLETSEWYADSLIESKLARNFTPRNRKEKVAKENKPADKVAKKKVKKQPKSKVVKSTSPNPFAK